MRTQVIKNNGSVVVKKDNGDIPNLIFEGAQRELKFRQAAMICHRLTTVGDDLYLESSVDVFARGRTFVLISLALLLLAVATAILYSTPDWASRLQQFKSILMLIIILTPVAYIYLKIEKRIRHFRLHRKIVSKLQELDTVKTSN